MKKILYLIRHATAEDGGNSPMFRDFERELNSTGIIEASRMGKFLADKGIEQPNLMISSAANRAKDTAKLFAERLGFDTDNIVLDENLYGGGPRAYLACVNKLRESVKSVAIVGHNPDITFFSEYLTRADIGGSMDKSSVLIIEFHNQTWAEVSSKSGDFIAYYSPKSISNQ